MAVQYSKNYFKIFLSQEAGTFGNDIEMEPQKPHPKFVYYIFNKNIYFVCNPMQVVVFCKNALILWNNDSNSPNLKVAQYLKNLHFSCSKEKVYQRLFKISLPNIILSYANKIQH